MQQHAEDEPDHRDGRQDDGQDGGRHPHDHRGDGEENRLECVETNDAIRVVRLDEEKHDADDGDVAEGRGHVVGHAGWLGLLRIAATGGRSVATLRRRIASLRWRCVAGRGRRVGALRRHIPALRSATLRRRVTTLLRSLLRGLLLRWVVSLRRSVVSLWRTALRLALRRTVILRRCRRWGSVLAASWIRGRRTRWSGCSALAAKLPDYIVAAVGAKCHVEILSRETTLAVTLTPRWHAEKNSARSGADGAHSNSTT